MTPLTKSEQRLKWLEGLRRPLTNDEQDELYRTLHANYMREWRAHRLAAEAHAEVLKADRMENERLLRRATRQMSKPVPVYENATPNDAWMDEARNGSAMLLEAIQRVAA